MPRFWTSISQPELHEVSQWLQDNSRRSFAGSDNSERYFISSVRVTEHFDHPRLSSILEVLYPGSDDFTRLAYEIRKDGYVCVFLILLCLGRGALIKHFLKYETLADSRLPLPQSDDFPKSLTFKMFDDVQQAFSAPKLQANTIVRSYKSERILPIQEKTRIATGECADVFRIQLHPDFDDLAPAAAGERLYILKVYHTPNADAEDTFKREIAAYDRIQRWEPLNSLARCYASYTYQGRSHIILEHANRGTLSDFMKNEPPSNANDRTAMYTSILSLGQALHRVHTDGGCHHDVQPLNIVVHDNNSNATDTELWSYSLKLIDFGKCHLHDAKNPDKCHRDTYGTRDYGAPETYRIGEFEMTSPLFVSQKIDIFSLGCVWLETVVWMVEGPDGVKRFRRDREDEVGSEDRLAFFHDGTRLLECVQRTIQKVKSLAGHDDRVTTPLCDFLIQDMLETDEEHRLGSLALCREAARIVPRREGTQLLGELETLQIKPREHPRCSKTLTRVTKSPHRRISRSPNGKRPPHPSGSSPEPQSNDTGSVSSARRPFGGVKRTWTLPEDYDDTKQLHSPTSNRHQIQQPVALSLNISNSTDKGKTVIGSARPYGHLNTNGPSRAKEPALDNNPDTQSPVLEPPPSYSRIPVLMINAAHHWLGQIGRGNGQARLSDDHYKDKLRNRDHVFIMDNTYTTAPHWDEMCMLSYLLASILRDCDPDGSEFYFTTSRASMQDRDPEKLYNLAVEQHARGYSNLEIALDKVIDKHEAKLNRAKRNGRPDRVTPMNIYVLTDGMWSEGNPEIVFLRLVQLLEDLRLDRLSIGIQFISFGKDPKGLDRMKLLDEMGKSYGVGDIVDTEPSNGNVWKMLLGAIDDVFDNSN